MVDRRSEDELKVVKLTEGGLTEDELTEDELTEDQLEEVAGGLATVLVPLCKHCQQRIAVHDMSVCAGCFLKLHRKDIPT